MANQLSYHSHLFTILVLVAVVSTVAIVVEGNVCSEAMGACGPIGDCDKRCKGKHSGGQGSCDLSLCTCYYTCGSPAPPPRSNCTAGLGLCSADCMDSCCNAKCATQFKQGAGFCDAVDNTQLCTCQYVCQQIGLNL